MAGQLTLGFGEAIKIARTQRGISQEELGRLAGLHRAHVGEIERGEISPTLESVQAIAEALHVAPSELIAAAETAAT